MSACKQNCILVLKGIWFCDIIAQIVGGDVVALVTIADCYLFDLLWVPLLHQIKNTQGFFSLEQAVDATRLKDLIEDFG